MGASLDHQTPNFHMWGAYHLSECNLNNVWIFVKFGGYLSFLCSMGSFVKLKHFNCSFFFVVFITFDISNSIVSVWEHTFLGYVC